LKKRILPLTAATITLASIVAILVIGGNVLAAGGKPKLDHSAQLNAGQCGGGSLVLNVTHKVINDPDSSVTGHNWANDSFSKHIQVWQTTTTSFCAVVHFEGAFTSVAGNSPQNTDPNIAAGISGTFDGGYRALFTGTLNPAPAYPTSGNLGTFDYGWDGTDGGAGNVTPFDWSMVYFGTDNLNLVWWGWIYRTPHNGTWVNACSISEQACPGNAGDITD
jgi:hypothetical protein